MTHKRSTARRVAASSIWARRSVSAEDDRVASLLRIYLPLLDVIFAAGGIVSRIYGVPALNETTPGAYVKGWSTAVTVVALACLAGVAFPERLWRLEFGGKAVLIGLLSLYVGSLIYLAFVEGDGARAALAIFICTILMLPVWRLFDIPRDREVHGWK